MHALTVANALTNNICAYLKMPIILKADNSSSFINSPHREVYKKIQITPDAVPGYKYWSKITERVDLDLGGFLRNALFKKNKDDWAYVPPYITLAVITERRKPPGPISVF